MAIVAGIVAGGSAVAVGASALVAVGVGLVAASAYDYAIDSLMEDAAVDTMSGRNVNTKSTSAEREVVYGEIRKGGAILWQDVAGTNNRFLYQITAIAHSECDSISDVYFDGNLAWTNGVYNSDYFDLNELNVVKIEVKTGTSTQSAISTTTAGTDTAVSYWVDTTSPVYQSHQLKDIAYVWTRFNHNPDYFPNGAPTVTAKIKGRKVYDPRIGSHNINNPSTWAWSDNPVLCLYDYLRNEDFGAGIPASEFDESQIEDAADFCDVSVGNPSRARYKCDGVVNTGQSIRQNIKNLLTCMNGAVTYAGGKLRIEPYEYKTPNELTLDEDIIIGDFSLTTKTPRQDSYNTVKGTFVSKHINYVVTEYPQQTSSSYKTDDGGEHILNLDLPFTTDTIRAQRLAKLVLLKSRMQSRIRAKLSAKALDYKVGDNINVSNASFGIVDQVYEITMCQIGFDEVNGIYLDIEARENVDSIYDHTASTDTEYVSGQVIELPDREETPAVPTTTINAIATVNYNDPYNHGDFEKGLLVNWAKPEGAVVDYYTVEHFTAEQYIREIGYLEYETVTEYRLRKKLTTPDTSAFIPTMALRDHKIRIISYANGRFNSTTEKTFTIGGYPDALGGYRKYTLRVDDVDVPPTNEQWTEQFGGLPITGSELLLYEGENYSPNAPSRTYIYQHDWSVFQGTKTDASFGSGTTYVNNMHIVPSTDISSAYNDISYSIVETIIEASTDGSTASSVDVAVSTAPAGGLYEYPYGLVTLSIAPSHYDNVSYNGYVYQQVRLVVRATYDSGNQTQDINVYQFGVVK